jgi:hypothetical protein
MQMSEKLMLFDGNRLLVAVNKDGVRRHPKLEIAIEKTTFPPYFFAAVPYVILNPQKLQHSCPPHNYYQSLNFYWNDPNLLLSNKCTH